MKTGKKPATPKRSGRPKIGARVQIILGPAHEAYAASVREDRNVSAGVRDCLERCMRLDARKPIDTSKI